MTASTGDQLLLAGGGHSHALLLRMWAMQPQRRPAGLISLINRRSTALYSGMVPGLIAGLYTPDEVAIDLRTLADRAGVALIIAEITGIDRHKRLLLLQDRAPLPYDRLSLDVGAVSPAATSTGAGSTADLKPIKPLEPALAFLSQEDGVARSQRSEAPPFHVLGAGLAGVEVALALRQRWPERRLILQGRQGQPASPFRRALAKAGITLALAAEVAPGSAMPSKRHGLNCTGSRAPNWLGASGLPVDARGRVVTERSLEVVANPGVFACGDCGVISADPRPASGVWAVRAAAILARNLSAPDHQRPLTAWHPQRRALQLLGGFRQGRPTAWALWGPLLLGPHPWLWHWKQAIDRRFMARFQTLPAMASSSEGNGAGRPSAMLCRGCAAKLPAAPLEAALTAAGLDAFGASPEDAHALPGCAGPVLQSVDGFPALVSDPWLNGRLTTLHACSDLWACGAQVSAAQAVVTLPLASRPVQSSLLSQTLSGVRSALEEQGAALIGGHSLEARHPDHALASLGVQVLLSVSGTPPQRSWPKRGLQADDVLLLSRPLGTGVLFAAAMAGATPPHALDQALTQMNRSQHPLLDELLHLDATLPGALHAATDITGFGLLGHLGEMLGSTPLQVQLDADAIPALPGVLDLLHSGYASSLAPANRRAWSLLDRGRDRPAAVALKLGTIAAGSDRHRALLELLVDPQTCGPLLIAVAPKLAGRLLKAPPSAAETRDHWRRIGTATAG